VTARTRLSFSRPRVFAAEAWRAPHPRPRVDISIVLR
jgi:hypothetical protein